MLNISADRSHPVFLLLMIDIMSSPINKAPIGVFIGTNYGSYFSVCGCN
jgi:hypothetical protein